MPKNNGNEKNIWVVLDHHKAGLTTASIELLGIGKEVAQKASEKLIAVIMGYNLDSVVKEASFYGADDILVLDHECLAHIIAESYVPLLKNLILEKQPRILLGATNELMRQIFARLAIEVESGLASDAIGVEWDNMSKLLFVQRSVYGGNLECKGAIEGYYPQMITLRPRVVGKAKKTSTASQIVAISVSPETCIHSIEILDEKEEQTGQIKLTEAEIIISGGRGLGGPEPFKMLQELSNVLSAAVGASRAAVDAGWIAYKHQVGQTGQTVQPRIYIACGISGAIQHLAGMQTSDIIVAINKDPDCTMMKIANFSLHGDLFKIIPLLTQKLRDVLN